MKFLNTKIPTGRFYHAFPFIFSRLGLLSAVLLTLVGASALLVVPVLAWGAQPTAAVHANPPHLNSQLRR
jgi:hypothetical protein